MKQFFLSPVEQVLGPFGQSWIAHAVNPTRFPGLTGSATFTRSGATGAPDPPWALVIVAAGSLVPLLGDPALGVLFEAGLRDIQLGAVSPALIAAIQAALTRAGTPWAARLSSLSYGGTAPVRAVIDAIGQAIDPAFDSYAFDCAGS